MSTLPPSAVKKFPDDSPEKIIYNFVEGLNEYIPVPNDRNRLAYNLLKFIEGQGDEPKILVKSTKITYKNISEGELVKKLEDGISGLKK